MLNDTRGEGKGWRKFNFLDLLQPLLELRSFGYPLDELWHIFDIVRNPKNRSISIIMQDGRTVEYLLLLSIN